MPACYVRCQQRGDEDMKARNRLSIVLASFLILLFVAWLKLANIYLSPRLLHDAILRKRPSRSSRFQTSNDDNLLEATDRTEGDSKKVERQGSDGREYRDAYVDTEALQPGTTQVSQDPVLYAFIGLPQAGQRSIRKVLDRVCADDGPAGEAQPYRCLDASTLFARNLFKNLDIKKFEQTKQEMREDMISFSLEINKVSGEMEAQKPAILFANAFQDTSDVDRFTFPPMRVALSESPPHSSSSHRTTRRSNLSLKSPNLFHLSKFVNEETPFKMKFIVLIDDIAKVWLDFRKTGKEEPPHKPGKYNYTVSDMKLFQTATKYLLGQLLLLEQEDFIVLDMEAPAVSRQIFNNPEFDGSFKQHLQRILREERATESSERQSQLEKLSAAEKYLLAVLQTTITASLPNIRNPDYGQQPARKISTVTDSDRFVFFAGIEGTGHHMWQDFVMALLDPSSKEKESDGRETVYSPSPAIHVDCSLNSMLYEPTVRCWNPYRTPFIRQTTTGLFCTTNTSSFATSLQMIQEKLQLIDAKGERAVETTWSREKRARVHLLNLVHRDYSLQQPDRTPNSTILPGCGSIASYPAFSSEDKAINKPDLTLISRLIGDSGKVFMPVILLRDINSVVLSDVWHRKFNGKYPALYELTVLFVSLANLVMEVLALRASGIAITCVHYEDGSTSLQQSLQGVFHPDLEVAHYIDRVRRVRVRSKAQVEADLSDLKEYLDWILPMKKLDTILRSLCS